MRCQRFPAWTIWTSILNDVELLARQFVDQQVLPIIEKYHRGAAFSAQLPSGDWRTRIECTRRMSRCSR